MDLSLLPDTVLRVDSVTGSRVLISGGGLGAGPAFAKTIGVAVVHGIAQVPAPGARWPVLAEAPLLLCGRKTVVC